MLIISNKQQVTEEIARWKLFLRLVKKTNNNPHFMAREGDSRIGNHLRILFNNIRLSRFLKPTEF